MPFYKKNNDNTLMEANSVVSSKLMLFAADKAKYTYPVDGWYWFKNEDEAYKTLGIQRPLSTAPEEDVRVELRASKEYIASLQEQIKVLETVLVENDIAVPIKPIDVKPIVDEPVEPIKV